MAYRWHDRCIHILHMTNHFFSSLAAAENISAELRYANQCYERMHMLLYSNYWDGLKIVHADNARAEWLAARDRLTGADVAAHYAALDGLLERARAPYIAREKRKAMAAAAGKEAYDQYCDDNWVY